MPARRRDREASSEITQVSVAGFKSIRNKQDIVIRPLTIIAGINSSGKSSIIQPLLLLKQTIEAPYDPGPLLLDGPNVSFTRMGQLLSRGYNRTRAAKEFRVGFSTSESDEVELSFGRAQSGEVRLKLLTWTMPTGKSFVISEDMSQAEIGSTLWSNTLLDNPLRALLKEVSQPKFDVSRRRWSLTVHASVKASEIDPQFRSEMGEVNFTLGPNLTSFEQAVRRIIHLPALRGNPKRTYRTAAVEDVYPGVFNDYTAGIIAAWQNRAQDEQLSRLREDLELLGLTWNVTARQLDDTSVELLVGRLPHPREGGTRDLVNIADVGFGVSQTLPVVVALQAAAPGQLVYLEQPEIHLHPRAQAAFSGLLRAAVSRGVRVVVETHSALLIRAIQTMVAKGDLGTDQVALHWFTRHPETGMTSVTSGTLDRFGSFADWPEDFDEVSLKTDHDYLTAVENAEAAEVGEP